MKLVIFQWALLELTQKWKFLFFIDFLDSYFSWKVAVDWSYQKFILYFLSNKTLNKIL